MKLRTLTTLLVAGAVAFLAGCAAYHKAPAGHEGHAAAAAATPAAAERTDVLYSCACGPECKCGSVGLKPGNCKCGKPMEWGHVVRIEGDTAFVCTCKEGCKCSADANDPLKCGCGNALKQVSLKGSGLYFCNCGGKCACNVLSDKPGQCKCGMELKQSN